MDSPAGELCPDRNGALLGLGKGLRGFLLAKLAVGTLVEAGERQNLVQLATHDLEVSTSIGEPDQLQTGLHERQYCVGGSISSLYVEEHPVEATPFRNLAGIVVRALGTHHASDIRAGAAFAEVLGESFDLGFREPDCCGHLATHLQSAPETRRLLSHAVAGPPATAPC